MQSNDVAIRALMLHAHEELVEISAKLDGVRAATDFAYRYAPTSGLRPQDDKTFVAVELARRTVSELVAAYSWWLEAQVEGLRCSVMTTVEHRSVGPLADVDFESLLDEDGNFPI